MAKLTEREQKLHDEAIAEGYKDETCPKCGAELLAHHHFIRCCARPCPMSSGKSILDYWNDFDAGRAALAEDGQ